MRRKLGVVVALAVALLPLPAPAQDSSASAPGVNPKDNITKIEVLYKHDGFENGPDVNSLTFKYDQALNKEWGFNVEAPLVHYKGFGLEESGSGDVQARLRYVKSFGQVSVLAGAELVAPTGSDDTLGRGKWQSNPVIGAVYAFSPQVFAFAGYKHFWSFAGDDERAAINESQPRFIMAYTDPKGWWLLGDAKFTKSWESLRPATLDTEVELGQMIGRSTAIWLRGGTSFLDSTRELGVNVGIRQLF
ncbi:MAG: hypothetical protein B7Y80_15130 [Hyphomicrobium sp. 32-62-53]|nr:MAG: hypothetical protein B7Y80_15130 [Hyphomicrobium sp. 32-62-53]